MRDDFLTREWADHRAVAKGGVAEFFKDVGAGLARLHAIQFDAPWKRDHAVRGKTC